MHFRFTDSRFKDKTFTSSYQLDGCALIFSLSSYESEVNFFSFINKWKKLLKYYRLNVRERLEIDTTPWISFLGTSYNSMLWGCRGMLKSRSGCGLWSWMWSPIDGNLYLCLGARSILVPEIFKLKNWLKFRYDF